MSRTINAAVVDRAGRRSHDARTIEPATRHARAALGEAAQPAP
jgi:hypothetical protein